MPSAAPLRSSPAPARFRIALLLAALRSAALWLAAAVAGAAVGGAGSALARGDELPPARHVLRLEQELGDLLPLDVNGDGLLDLVALEVDHSRRDGPARARVFVQTPTGFTAPVGPGDLLPEGITLAGAGQFVQGPGLALLTADRVHVWIWHGDHFAPEGSVPVEGLFPQPGGGLHTGIVWVADLNGDGLSELAVPRPDGLTLLRQDAQGRWLSGGFLRTRARGQLLTMFRRKVAGYDLPAMFLLDAAPAGSHRWREIVAFSDGVLYLFQPGASAGEGLGTGGPGTSGPGTSGPGTSSLGTGGPGTSSLGTGGSGTRGTAGEHPPALQQDLQPPQPFDPSVPYDPPLQLIAAEDLNGDGLVDLVFSKTKSGDSDFNARTRTLIHYGRPAPPPAGVRFAPEPDQVYDSEGFSLPFLVDLNRDRRPDLVLVNVEVNFWTAIKALIARSVTAEAGFYLMSDQRLYPRQPDATGRFSVKFSLGRATHQPIALFGDFNGDGLPDLLLSLDKERLGVHWGRAKDFWADRPDEIIQDLLPIRPERVRVVDLNGDGRDDLIFLYGRDDVRQMPTTFRTVTVLLSRYGASNAAQEAKPAGPNVHPGPQPGSKPDPQRDTVPEAKPPATPPARQRVAASPNAATP